MRIMVYPIGFLILIAGLLSGCGETEEQKRFRQELVEKALHDDVRKLGDAFLAGNAKRPGVKITPSGLQYEILHSGSGASPSIKDKVTVKYEGQRVDGYVFDSTYKREKPAVFPVRKVIKGWREGLKMMHKGDVWMLYIPSELAYAAKSPDVDIPANSTLIFKIELLDFEEDKEEY